MISNKKKIYYILLISFVVLINLIILYLIDYECPFHKYFNIWCSGCGGMRMIKEIIHLNFYQAFRYNPLLFILLVCFIIFVIVDIIIYIKKKVIYIPSYKYLIGLLIILIVYMIIRNIPLFSYLIPTKV